jgi:hypothetical protein
MSFGRSKTGGAEILVAAREVLEAYRNDPELAPLLKRHAEAVAAAAKATRAKTGGESELRRLALQIGRPDLADDISRFRRLLKEAETRLEATPAPMENGDVRRARALGAVVVLRRDLNDAEQKGAACSLEVPEARLRQVPPDMREAYGAARELYAAATKAADDAALAVRDAQFYLDRARAAAAERLRPRMLELHAMAVRRLNDALEASAVESSLNRQLVGLFRAGIGRGAGGDIVEDVSWPEFSAANEYSPSKLDTWRDSLRNRAPHARVA